MNIWKDMLRYTLFLKFTGSKFNLPFSNFSTSWQWRCEIKCSGDNGDSEHTEGEAGLHLKQRNPLSVWNQREQYQFLEMWKSLLLSISGRKREYYAGETDFSMRGCFETSPQYSHNRRSLCKTIIELMMIKQSWGSAWNWYRPQMLDLPLGTWRFQQPPHEILQRILHTSGK